MPSPRTMAGCVAALAGLAVLGGCSRGPSLPAVAVPLPSADPSGCARFAARLPDTLGRGLPRRGTIPEDSRVAAYGDPPVVVRCGAPYAATYRKGEPLVSVNEVAWYQQVGDDEVTWSTPTAFVNVELVVPRRYESQGGLLSVLSGAVRAAQPLG